MDTENTHKISFTSFTFDIRFSCKQIKVLEANHAPTKVVNTVTSTDITLSNLVLSQLFTPIITVFHF